MGTNTTYDALNTTKPYYRAGHVWIYRKDSGFNITDWNSPDLRKGVIGIVDKNIEYTPFEKAIKHTGKMNKKLLKLTDVLSI